MIKSLGDAVSSLLPAELRDELRENIEAVIRSNFEKMDLVSREQFQIQEKVLHRTRQRVQQLEAQVQELEQRVREQQSQAR